jgi:SAM-dependent methyltransferase
MATQPGTSYDEIPYESQAFHETHPDRLASLAALHGLDAPPIATARVLEIGCAGGGNLIPLALALPEATFVGIDLSSRQVEEGRAIVSGLGLTNVALSVGDVAEAESGAIAGAFDYIICHGVYSWVPAPVRAAILARIRRQLAPTGVALVSYNVYPGWHGLGALREAMLFHAAGLPPESTPAQRAAAVRELLDELVANQVDPNTPYAQFLRREVGQLKDKRDSYLLHEYLEAENQPFRFHEFREAAAGHGLAYLTDARHRMTPAFQDPPVQAALSRLSADPLRQEQYLDEIRNRTFRRSLLVHEGRSPAPPRPEALAGLRAIALAGPVNPRPEVHSDRVEEFRTPDGQAGLAAGSPAAKATLLALAAQWPRSVSVPELRSRAADLLDAGAPGGRAAVGPDAPGVEAVLLRGFGAGVVELTTFDPPAALDLSLRPTASPYARLQAESGNRVTNLRHRVAELSAFDRLVLGLADGTRDRGELTDDLVAACLTGTFPLNRDGRPIADAIEVRGIMERSLEPSLLRLRGSLLLVD